MQGKNEKAPLFLTRLSGLGILSCDKARLSEQRNCLEPSGMVEVLAMNLEEVL